MLSLAFAAALALTAPPAKPVDKTGRITLWIGEKVESFLPDGSDRTSTPAPDVDPIGNVICFEPRWKIAAHTESPTQDKNAKFGRIDRRLVVIPLDEYGKRYTLNGYVADSFFSSADGSRIYFNGCEGDEADRSKTGWSKAFVLDLKTKKVEPVPLPENHILKAVLPDGKTLITSRVFADAKTVSRKLYLIPDGVKPVEILKEKWFLEYIRFSSDGSKVLVHADSGTGQPDIKDGIIRNAHIHEFFLLDVVTRTTRLVQNIPKEVDSYALSPDGTRVAILKYENNSVNGIPTKFEFKVHVADLESGGTPKEIYRVKTSGRENARAFWWK
jgi:hypothetical protein